MTIGNVGGPANHSDVIARYRPLAYSIANEFFLPGGDIDDVRQEALIGLWKATRDWRRERTDGTFATFARLCIRRQILSALKRHQREKQRHLNESLSADTYPIGTDTQGDPLFLIDILSDDTHDPVRRLEAKEQLTEMAYRMIALSPCERRAVEGYANGLSYRDIGTTKQVDNALQRARRKLAA